MTAAHPPVLPGSRILSGWWQALAPRRPQALWVGYLLFHHVEALVRVQRPQALDPFTLLVLQALSRASDRTVPGIDRLLHLGPRMLTRVLHGLAAERLAATEASGEWGPTALGQRILRGEGPHANDERRVFHFLGGTPRPQFVSLNHSAGVPASASGEEPFDPSVLRACVRQSTDWKQKHGFPLDVEEVVSLETAGNHHDPAAASSWQRVIVAHPERVLTVLILQTGDGDQRRLEGFGVRSETWEIGPEPAFTIPVNGNETLAELTAEPTNEAWRQAWRTWCSQHRVLAAEADACRIEPSAERLLVQAPSSVYQKLQNPIREAADEGIWILAGDGPIWRGARVDLVSVG